MIAFASLFLGLVIGTQTTTFLTGDPVVYVEVILDDRTVGFVNGEPWSLDINFGDDLIPHELVAIGYDAARKEVARARQWVNLSRQPAETSIVLKNGEAGRGVTASLVWNSVISDQPASISVSFDGEPIEVLDPAAITLPDHDPEQIHFIRAEVDFSDTVTSRSESTFGGAFAESVSTELTAVPVLLGDSADRTNLEDLRGVSRRDSQSLQIVATERGPSEILIVLDEGSRERLEKLGRLNPQNVAALKEQEAARRADVHNSQPASRRAIKEIRVGTSRKLASSSLRRRMQLEDDLHVQFLSPFSERQERSEADLDIFPPSRIFTAEDGGFYWLIMQAEFASVIDGAQRLTDAVAAGSLLVTRSNRRRAVVLILGENPKDGSLLTASQVERFLLSLRVPLFIWTTGSAADPFASNWSSVTTISSLRDLEDAVQVLFKNIDRQRIVWFDGIHLPQDVVISSQTVFSPAAK